jgi:2-C-methyl-D-erythritol 4-phosphate cytidylyltransferase
VTNTAVILGGGQGKRLPGEVPKQFLSLGPRPLIAHTVEAFQQSSAIDAIVVVVPAGWEGRCTAMLEPLDPTKVQGVIAGGQTRQLSCWQALQHLRAEPPHIVVVHDAARPLVTGEMIEQAVREGTNGMTFGLPVIDTVVECVEGETRLVLPREGLRQVQTPQAFPFRMLYDAHHRALKEGIRAASDDAGLVMRAGHGVQVLEGNLRNLKVTSPFDLELVRCLLRDG